MTVTTIFLVITLICFGFATVLPYPIVPAPNTAFYARLVIAFRLVSLGLFFWVLSILIGSAHVLHLAR
jgi:hypothetical protein